MEWIGGLDTDLDTDARMIAMKIHRKLGPGFREDMYQHALEQSFSQDGIAFESQVNLAVYEGDNLLGFYIPEFIIDKKVIVEIKAFATLHQKYLGQVITYLNFTGLTIGLLINFGERSLHPRRVFPSPHPRENGINHQWMFVPESLQNQKMEGDKNNVEVVK